MAGAYIEPDVYITHFPSSNNRTVELYRKNDHRTFVIRLNDKKVVEAIKPLAFEWLIALVKPEYHKEIRRLEREL